VSAQGGGLWQLGSVGQCQWRRGHDAQVGRQLQVKGFYFFIFSCIL